MSAEKDLALVAYQEHTRKMIRRMTLSVLRTNRTTVSLLPATSETKREVDVLFLIDRLWLADEMPGDFIAWTNEYDF